MKAFQLVRPRSFAVVEVPAPQLNSSNVGQLLVRTRWVSMCGSDIPFFAGSKRFGAYPLLPGAPIHECVGQVAASTSPRFKPGDHVVAIPDGNQGLAEFYVAQDARATQLPPDLGSRDTSCLIQPLATVMNAVDSLKNIEDQSIAVIGLGSIGLLFCWLLKKRGAGRIVGIDPLAYRCQLAEALGATSTYPMRSIEVAHAARQHAGEWDYPDICIEAVGHQMETLNDCFELVRKRGAIIAFGVPDQPIYAIEFEMFFRKNAHLIAVVTPEWHEYLSKARDLFSEYRAELEMFVTHRFAIQDAEQAFTLYECHEQSIVKAVLEMSWPEA